MQLLPRIAAACFLPILLSFAPAEWKTFESKASGFKINFPGDVSTSQQKVPSAIGDLNMNMFTVQPPVKNYDDNIVYMVIQLDYPPEVISSADTTMTPVIFRSAIDGGVANAKGKLLSEKNITYNGYPGREIKVKLENAAGGMDGFLSSRIYLAKNRMYMLQIVTPQNKEGNASIKTFWDSFALIK